MVEHLNPEEETDTGERVVLYPVYPFLTREQLFAYLDEREGSYRFPGGYVIRDGAKLSDRPRKSTGSLGRGLFSLSDYAFYLTRAMQESAAHHSARGVLIEDGAEVSLLAEIAEGAIIRRGAHIIGKCIIGENVEIGVGSQISESEIGAGTIVQNSVIMAAKVGANCRIGPNAYIRPGSEVKDGCRIGDFVELKNAVIGQGSKISHLAYVGDACLGEQVNVGCGVVFVNYDGRKKSKTLVGDRCFIGSNCNLIAPLEIGSGVFIAAGTTLTQNLNENDFCIGRSRETIKSDCASKYYTPAQLKE